MKPEGVRTVLEQVTHNILSQMATRHRMIAIFHGIEDEDMDDPYFGYTEETINKGRCMIWARKAVEALGGPSSDCRFVWIDDGESVGEYEFAHAVLFYQGKYYDCETLDGVERLIDIPYLRELEAEDLFLTFLPELKEIEGT